MNYFNNDDINDKINYDSIEKGNLGKGGVANGKNKDNDTEQKQLINNESINYDNQSEKEKKICRFVLDYCRASPFMTLLDKHIQYIGWRNQKYCFDVEFKNTFNGELDEEITSVIEYF